METKILSLEEINEAADALKNEGIICFPTETVYGIGVTCNSELAYENLIKVKGRSPDKPISLMASSLDQGLPYLDIDLRCKKLIEIFYPGEVTFLLKACKGISPWIDLGTGVVGLRVPASDYVLKLIEKVGVPCLVTSANISGQKTSTKFEETLDVFNGLVEAIVKGECISNVASTIIDLSKGEPVLIRQGKLDFELVKKVWEELQ